MKKYGPTLQTHISKKPHAIGKLLWQEGIIPTAAFDEMEADGGGTVMKTITNQNIQSMRKTASVLLYNEETASVATEMLSEGKRVK